MSWMPQPTVHWPNRQILGPPLLGNYGQALKNGDLGSSALAEYVFSSNHWVDLSKVLVINTHRHSQTCCMLECPGTSRTNRPTQQGQGYSSGLYAVLLVWPYYFLALYYAEDGDDNWGSSQEKGQWETTNSNSCYYIWCATSRTCCGTCGGVLTIWMWI